MYTSCTVQALLHVSLPLNLAPSRLMNATAGLQRPVSVPFHNAVHRSLAWDARNFGWRI